MKSGITTVFAVGLFLSGFSVQTEALSGGPHPRYCKSDTSDIFTGIAYETAYTPNITVKVDPAFEVVQLSTNPAIPGLPLAPVYDLVVTAVPTINEYCLPVWNAVGEQIAPAIPPETLPFPGHIIIGESSESPGGIIFVTGPGSFKRAGKYVDWRTGQETDQWRYEWKIKGWPNGIADEAKMIRLFKAIEAQEPINVRIDVERKNQPVVYEKAPVSFGSCQKLGQNGEIVWGRKKIITLQGFAPIGLTDPLHKWMNSAAPGSIAIKGRTHEERNTRDLIAEIKNQLKKGYHVMVAGHSAGAITAFNLKENFSGGKCVEFLFIDPPYADALTSKISAIKKARDGDIENNKGTVNWTEGQAFLHFFKHAPFSFKWYRGNKARLKGLEDTIKKWQFGEPNWHPQSKPVRSSRMQSSQVTAAVGSASSQSAPPVISRLSAESGSIGTRVDIGGKAFGTRVTVYFENDSGGFAWTEGLPVKKENGLDTVTYTIPAEMSAVDIEDYEIRTMPVAPGKYSISLSEDGREGSDPVSFEVTAGAVRAEEISAASIADVDVDPSSVRPGEKLSVRWKSENASDVTIDLLNYKTEKVERMIEASVENKNEYEWTVPDDLDDDVYRIRVSDASNPAVKSISGKFDIEQGEKLGFLARAASLVHETVSKFVRRSAAPTDTSTPATNPGFNPPPSYPVRALVLDTFGVSIANSTTDQGEVEAELRERTGQAEKKWKVKYDRKGHSRRKCDPPMFNLSFDKKDSKGRKRELFKGRSTYEGFSELEYQKIRFIPECDIWNDSFAISPSGDLFRLGFGGKMSPIFREYVIHEILRDFGIPTAQVIGFAEVAFVGTDEKYEGHVFRYLMIQRPDEQDDQKPFTVQFKLDPKLYESPAWPDFRVDGARTHRLVSIGLTDVKTEEPITLPLDPVSAVRLELLTTFLRVYDRKILDNEDYGKDISTSTALWKTIPFGFDASLECAIIDPAGYHWLKHLMSTVPGDRSAEYGRIYYDVVEEIFGEPASLSRMLRAVDAYPFEGPKELLKDYLRLSFDRFAAYYGSESFANTLGETHRPFAASRPFDPAAFAESERVFVQACVAKRSPVSATARIATTSPLQLQGEHAEVSYVLDIRTGDAPVRLFKTDAFLIELQSVKTPSRVFYMRPTYAQPESLSDTVGPYYLLPAGTTTTFRVQGSVLSSHVPFDEYEATFSKVRFSNDLDHLVLAPNATNRLWLGRKAPVMLSLSPSRVEETGRVRVSGEYLGTSGLVLGGDAVVGGNAFALPPFTVLLGQNGFFEFVPKEVGLSPGTYLLTILRSASESESDALGREYRYAPLEVGVTINAVESKPSIAVVRPNGKEQVYSGEDTTISWKTANITGATLELELQRYVNGAHAGSRPVASDVTNTGTYLWSIPKDFPPGFYTVVAGAYGKGVAIVDESDAPFEILPPRELAIDSVSPAVTAPGKEIVLTGRGFKPSRTVIEVRRTAPPASLVLYTIPSKEIPLSNVADQLISVPIPEKNTLGVPLVPGQYYVQAFDMQTGTESNQVFIDILSTGVLVLSGVEVNPNPVDVGSKLSITWKSKGILNVNIELLNYKVDKVARVIATTTANADVYEWTVPDDLDDDVYRIRVSDASNPAVKSISGKFDIMKIIVVHPIRRFFQRLTPDFLAQSREERAAVNRPEVEFFTETRETSVETTDRIVQPFDGNIITDTPAQTQENLSENLPEPLSVSCASSLAKAMVKEPITWSAYASGGEDYAYSWSGSDNLHGTSGSVTVRYSTPGQKAATVTVTSGRERSTAECKPVTVRDEIFEPAYE